MTSWPLLALFFGLVWGQVDNNPLLLFSFESRRILFFGHIISWHDLHLLAGLLIAGAFLLFFLAVAAGRVWCGFACPQSIWTWLFLRLENITEGPAKERLKNEQLPLLSGRLLRRIAKHSLWILLASATALTFTGYFVPIRTLLADALSLQLPIYTVGWLIAMTALTYLNAGLMREKVCLHACPYSRFQTVMFDQDTLTVGYDMQRGEPRANLRSSEANSGDCVDCGLCVQVCPTGIDIRDGLQAACIDCGACIDACDPVMKKLGRPVGLIRLASEAQYQGAPRRLLRPQLFGYGIALLSTIATLIYGFNNTTDLSVAVQRDRGALFTQLDEKTFCNSYKVKVEGFDEYPYPIIVSLDQHDLFQLFGPETIDLNESNATWIYYRVCTESPAAPRMSLTFTFDNHQALVSKTTTFLTARI